LSRLTGERTAKTATGSSGLAAAAGDASQWVSRQRASDRASRTRAFPWSVVTAAPCLSVCGLARRKGLAQRPSCRRGASSPARVASTWRFPGPRHQPPHATARAAVCATHASKRSRGAATRRHSNSAVVRGTQPRVTALPKATPVCVAAAVRVLSKQHALSFKVRPYAPMALCGTRPALRSSSQHKLIV